MFFFYGKRPLCPDFWNSNRNKLSSPYASHALFNEINRVQSQKQRVIKKLKKPPKIRRQPPSPGVSQHHVAHTGGSTASLSVDEGFTWKRRHLELIGTTLHVYSDEGKSKLINQDKILFSVPYMQPTFTITSNIPLRPVLRIIGTEGIYDLASKQKEMNECMNEVDGWTKTLDKAWKDLYSPEELQKKHLLVKEYEHLISQSCSLILEGYRQVASYCCQAKNLQPPLKEDEIQLIGGAPIQIKFQLYPYAFIIFEKDEDDQYEKEMDAMALKFVYLSREAPDTLLIRTPKPSTYVLKFSSESEASQWKELLEVCIASCRCGIPSDNRGPMPSFSVKMLEPFDEPGISAAVGRTYRLLRKLKPDPSLCEWFLISDGSGHAGWIPSTTVDTDGLALPVEEKRRARGSAPRTFGKVSSPASFTPKKSKESLGSSKPSEVHEKSTPRNIVPPNSSHSGSTKNSPNSVGSVKQKEKPPLTRQDERTNIWRQEKTFIKSRLSLSEAQIVSGTITLTRIHFEFEPDPQEFLVIRNGVEMYSYRLRLERISDFHLKQFGDELMPGENMIYFRFHKKEVPVPKTKKDKKAQVVQVIPDAFCFILAQQDAQSFSRQMSQSLAAVEHMHIQRQFSIDLDFEKALDTTDQELLEAADSLNLLTKSEIFTNDNQRKLYKFLPPTCRIQNLDLLFTTSRHGSSLNTFTNKAEDFQHTLLVIKDTHGFTFGAFATEYWHFNNSYYGTGESFLFSLSPKFRVYKWTQMNDYFQFCSLKGLNMGSGTRHRKAHSLQQNANSGRHADLKNSHKFTSDGNIEHKSGHDQVFASAPSIVVQHHDHHHHHHTSHHKTHSTSTSSTKPKPSSSDIDAASNETTQYGLWLDSEFIYGTSAMSDTYFNRSLSSSEEFQISVVELWTLTQMSRTRETASKST